MAPSQCNRAAHQARLCPADEAVGRRLFPDGRGDPVGGGSSQYPYPAALYEAFEPVEARRVARKLEFHYTPKHGSWLNRAECEFAVLASQCLDRRIPEIETLRREIAAWQTQRNQHQAKINWQFGTDLARIELKRLYPSAKESAKTLVPGEASPIKIIETDH